MAEAIVYCDGLCEPKNPGGIATYGYIIYIGDKIASRNSGVVGYGRDMTNNVAEYTAAIEAMKKLIEMEIDYMTLRSDSQLLIRQLNGVYRVSSPRILPLYSEAVELADKFKEAWFEWVPREMNEEADRLSREALYRFLKENPDIYERYRGYWITEKQARYIKHLLKKHDMDIPENLMYMSKREASKLIDKLLNL